MFQRTYSLKIYTVPDIKTCQGIEELALLPPTNSLFSDTFSIQGGISAHIGGANFLLKHELYSKKLFLTYLTKLEFLNK